MIAMTSMSALAEVENGLISYQNEVLGGIDRVTHAEPLLKVDEGNVLAARAVVVRRSRPLLDRARRLVG
jgi:hypothetical protein